MGTGVVGPVAGAITGTLAGASGAQNAGRGFDVAVGDLFFNLANNDERPYQRATAQFKKDQLDAGQNPGDQSLTGWWSRGQLSFHKGAGITYYEVSQGETVIDRYAEAEGVSPFTPGRVTLCPDWAVATPDSHTDTTFVAPSGDNLVVLDSGSVFYGEIGEAATEYTPAADAAHPQGQPLSAATVGGGDIFVATSGKEIHRIGVGDEVVTVYPEQGFEAGLDSWDSEEHLVWAAGAVTNATDKFFEGAKSAKVVWPDKDTSWGSVLSREVAGLEVGTAYTMVAKVWVPAATTGDVSPIAWPATWTETPITVFDGWTTVAYTFVPQATTVNVGIYNADPVAGHETWLDKVVVYRGTRDGYDDGSTPVDAIYSHANQISGLFYAKDRLFMVDDANTWYQLDPNPTAALPVAITAGDKVFSMSGSDRSCVTDTPGPVLIGNGSRIFAVSVDSTGAIPTLSGPVQVADLPPQERILALGYHLGFVVIVTTEGVRIGLVAESGSVTYGPLLFEWTSYPTYTTVGRRDVTVNVAGGSEVYSIDLSQQIGNGLEFAQTKLPTPLGGSEANYGVTTAPDGRLVVWSDGELFIEHATDLTSSGVLTTGYHRFATLEPKRFESVRLRGAGTKGTIAVAKVDQNGSATPLFTLDMSTSHTAEIGLGLTEPAEALALQFTLSRDSVDATGGPTLLGYQLRALPQPQRQRLIRVPLLVADVERRQPARPTGHLGSAWERLRALEDLESSGVAVLFKDFRTGESASVYIESVEFTNPTPPTSGATGFGGTCFLTLRKL